MVDYFIEPLNTSGHEKQNVVSPKFCQQMHSLLKHKMLQLTLKISLYVASTRLGPFGHHQGTYDGTLLKLQSL
jgi:hypothetical protein